MRAASPTSACTSSRTGPPWRPHRRPVPPTRRSATWCTSGPCSPGKASTSPWRRCAGSPTSTWRSWCAPPRRPSAPDRCVRRAAASVWRIVVWHHGVDRTEVAAWLAGAAASLAPLRSGARNVTQGCCPRKVLESLAAGTPVVASDLPAVREIMRDDEHGRLVPPDRPDALARALRVLLDHPELGARWGEAGRRHIADHLSWRHSCERLAAVHDGLGSGDVRA
ncbi:MAG: glycosyltransferase family 4 protein [Acidimicrobiales bacterium]